MKASSRKFTGIQIGIILLGIITGLVHLIVLNVMLLNDGDSFSVPFTLNGLGYLGLLGMYFLPLPFLAKQKKLIRWAFIGFTAITILAWVFMGSRGLVGYGDKLVEVGLVLLLALDR